MTMTAATPTPPPTLTDHEARIVKLEAQVAELRRELEFERMSAIIDRRLEQADRGETRPAREALEELRRKHNIPCQ